MRGTERSLAERARSVLFVLGLFLPSFTSLDTADAREAAAPRLRLDVPSELRVGAHAHVTLFVELPAAAAEPLLVTPYREGEAIEVVKGRFLRSDALDPNARPLRFELPVLARAAGTALLGVRLLAYLCSPRCRTVEADARANVVVLPR